jgi:hypothetical protein
VDGLESLLRDAVQHAFNCLFVDGEFLPSSWRCMLEWKDGKDDYGSE